MQDNIKDKKIFSLFQICGIAAGTLVVGGVLGTSIFSSVDQNRTNASKQQNLNIDTIETDISVLRRDVISETLTRNSSQHGIWQKAIDQDTQDLVDDVRIASDHPIPGDHATTGMLENYLREARAMIPDSQRGPIDSELRAKFGVKPLPSLVNKPK